MGALIADTAQTILLVTPVGREEETITRLSRVGFDGTIGYLDGGFETWQAAGKEYDSIASISAEELKKTTEQNKPLIYDVRKESEFQTEHVVSAENTPLDFINDHMDHFPSQETFYIQCAGGYRSVIAASILKSRGIHDLVDIKGGFAAMKAAGMDVTAYVCPSTLK